jgi:hypothetical protein
MSSMIIIKLIISHEIIMKDSWHFIRMVKYFMNMSSNLQFECKSEMGSVPNVSYVNKGRGVTGSSAANLQ